MTAKKPTKKKRKPCESPDVFVAVNLRDYFAGQALIGILAARQGFLVDVGTDNAPMWAYSVADAMILERSKGGA